jgi:dTDP-4-dehydrorhamnose 3,5-epimerase
MEIIHTKLEGCLVLRPRLFEDERGYFFESFNQKQLNKAVGYPVHFVQDNQSFSSYGVLRGLHAQSGKHAQAKLVRVLQGEVLDVAVDMRAGSPTYGQYHSEILSAENKKQLFIPRGFLHGFVVLSQTADFFYKCDNFYHKAAEVGLIYNDSSVNINWQISGEQLVVSAKDMVLPRLKSTQGSFLMGYHPHLLTNNY